MDRLQKESKQKTKGAAKTAAGPFVLPPLPFALNALTPLISARTLKFHYGKHHKGYVDKLNELVQGTPFADMPLDEVVKQTAHDADTVEIFHNAGQAWNHALYWNSLSPARSRPSAALKQAIERDFSGMYEFKKKLAKVATAHFASGWAWLIAKNGKLQVLDTPDADTPMADGATCLLTIDVWEHAYYLDRQNERKAYVEAVIDGLLNWKFASATFETTAK